MRHKAAMFADSILTASPAPTLADARATLERVWGHADFRGRQAEVVTEILAGRDVVAVLPTGGGKSVCYQIPAMLRPGLGLVVSPLIALMTAQVEALKQQLEDIEGAIQTAEEACAWMESKLGEHRPDLLPGADEYANLLSERLNPDNHFQPFKARA